MGFRPREVAHLVSYEISRRMHSESCLGTPWGRVMSIFVKTYILAKDVLGDTHGKKSVESYIEWCSQSTKRLNLCQRYEDTIVISYYDIMIC